MLSESSEEGLLKSDGTISPAQFTQGAHAFALKWNSFCYSHHLPPCSWLSSSNPTFFSDHQVDGYLSIEKMCIFRSNNIDGNMVSDAGMEQLNYFESETCAREDMLDTHEVHYYDFHILYSNSYRIPVLYFRGYCSDGQPLMLNQIERDLPANSAKVLTESKWTFITQLEHPYLNRPWYTLHPCGTNELMKLLVNTCLSKAEDTPERYLISWFSVVSQVVGLKIPLEIATPRQM
ncbi:ubiquitin-like-conjugating enzyme ATG10 isoform X2 [Silene latifolia]|uniref:ubiquitin-like-conjugating enzyme ATG10 isoform X2 n=1 Tax=Silene latifolia TaxID=37657 RepID=UPI003D780B0C